MKILCTEGKSVGALGRPGNVVRVFVDGDMAYGYWVEEDALMAMLEVETQREYLRAVGGFTADVEPAVAQKIIDMGHTPFQKQRVV